MAWIIRSEKDFDDRRRDFLVSALGAGLLTGGAGWSLSALASIFGDVPRKLPEGQSVFQFSGDVRINDQPVASDTLIRPGDRVSTGQDGSIVAVVGADAFMLRQNSDVVLDVAKASRRLFRLVTGAMLMVFGRSEKRPIRFSTPTATIGIRGTGVYAEAEPGSTYLCTCYGETLLTANTDPRITENIISEHHDAPRYILAEPDSGELIIPAPFKNHTDLELVTLEALVGREVPFGLGTQLYDGPRRGY